MLLVQASTVDLVYNSIGRSEASVVTKDLLGTFFLLIKSLFKNLGRSEHQLSKTSSISITKLSVKNLGLTNEKNVQT